MTGKWCRRVGIVQGKEGREVVGVGAGTRAAGRHVQAQQKKVAGGNRQQVVVQKCR